MTGNGEERVIWRGAPSQILNLGIYALSFLMVIVIIAGAVITKFWILLLALLLPLTFAAYHFLQVRSQTFEITTERVRFATGIFNRVTNELELYRVKDITVEEPFFFRLIGLGNVVLDTSDKSTPQLTIPAVGDVNTLRERLRESVEQSRERKGVREIDYE
ncbi:membrane-flanked domain DUF304 [Thalassoporum mexicanum PCC 7367]|uniref:PH domain-containing protein n=1 Tax=Thalassoporum mexicanum TaxID=3457544 RepID=UPI00029FCB3A|nr:PH domain-containing protein [Pseudanabaena sp. PCC 7367]AFY71287.1 membrane-flanked domain DUF304 [Pseudanabaena sp. PCC 7367]